MKKTIYEQLKNERLRQGVSVNEMAERCGMYHSGVSRIESGRFDARLSMIEKMSHALGMSVELKKKGGD